GRALEVGRGGGSRRLRPTAPATAGAVDLCTALLPAGIVIAPVVVVPAAVVMPAGMILPGAVVTTCIAGALRNGAGARAPAGRTAAGTEPGRDDGVIVPATGPAAAHHRRLPRPLVDVHDDTPMRGRQRDLPYRAVVQVIGLDLDGPAVRALGLGVPLCLRLGDMPAHGRRRHGRSGGLLMGPGRRRCRAGRRGDDDRGRGRTDADAELRTHLPVSFTRMSIQEECGQRGYRGAAGTLTAP